MHCSFERKKVLQLITLLKEFGLTPNKIWSEKGSEFYDRSLKSWLQNNHIQIFSTQ